MGIEDVYRRTVDEQAHKQLRADGGCPECDGTLATHHGEITCESCGLVVEHCRLERGPQRYTRDDEDGSPRRTGAPLTPSRHDRGLSTEIGHKRDATGSQLSGTKQVQLARLRREHSRARFDSKADRNLAHALTDIARMNAALELGKGHRDEASRIYRVAHDEGLIQGRAIETMSAGAVYAACRCRGTPLSPGEIADVTRCAEDKVLHGYRVLNVELELGAEVIGPHQHVPHIVSALDLPDRVRHRALQLASMAIDAGITNGRAPAGVAAACVYVAADEMGPLVTQEKAADAAGVSTPTLRKRAEELQAEL